MGEMVSLTAEDGHKFAAYRAAPKGAPKGGLVIIQEIFGVNHHIRNVTDSFAAEGYVALAPAIFDRAERGFETGYKPEDIELGRSIRGKIDMNDMVKDIRAAVKSPRRRRRAVRSSSISARRTSPSRPSTTRASGPRSPTCPCTSIRPPGTGSAAMSAGAITRRAPLWRARAPWSSWRRISSSPSLSPLGRGQG